MDVGGFVFHKHWLLAEVVSVENDGFYQAVGITLTLQTGEHIPEEQINLTGAGGRGDLQV